MSGLTVIWLPLQARPRNLVPGSNHGADKLLEAFAAVNPRQAGLMGGTPQVANYFSPGRRAAACSPHRLPLSAASLAALHGPDMQSEETFAELTLPEPGDVHLETFVSHLRLQSHGQSAPVLSAQGGGLLNNKSG